MEQRREKLGFPSWVTVKFWLDPNCVAKSPELEKWTELSIKNPEIPILADYREDADDKFWEKFPKRQLPSAVKSKVNVLALKKNILKVKDKMARSEMKRAKKLISDLKERR